MRAKPKKNERYCYVMCPEHGHVEVIVSADDKGVLKERDSTCKSEVCPGCWDCAKDHASWCPLN